MITQLHSLVTLAYDCEMKKPWLNNLSFLWISVSFSHNNLKENSLVKAYLKIDLPFTKEWFNRDTYQRFCNTRNVSLSLTAFLKSSCTSEWNLTWPTIQTRLEMSYTFLKKKQKHTYLKHFQKLTWNQLFTLQAFFFVLQYFLQYSTSFCFSSNDKILHSPRPYCRAFFFFSLERLWYLSRAVIFYLFLLS